MISALVKKLQLKEEFSVLLFNANPRIHPLFDGIRFEYEHFNDKDFDSVILFTKNETEISKYLPKAGKHLKSNGLFWLSYPKKSGNISTNLNRDKTWSIIKEHEMEPVRLISINDDWSSMRLRRIADRNKPSTFGQDPPGVDRSSKTVIPPDDLQNLLKQHPDASAFFDKLAFTYKREFVGWIHQAKKQETRERRVYKTIELLKAGKKTK